MEKVEITKDELKFLVELAIQFGIDSPELVSDQKSREKIAIWMVSNTINDINQLKILINN